MRQDIPQHGINLGGMSPNTAEYAAVTITLGAATTTIVSSHIQPGQRHAWDTSGLVNITRPRQGCIMICGDFNVRHIAWVTGHTAA